MQVREHDLGDYVWSWPLPSGSLFSASQMLRVEQFSYTMPFCHDASTLELAHYAPKLQNYESK